LGKKRGPYKPRQINYQKNACHAHHPSGEKTQRDIGGKIVDFDICGSCQTVYVDVTAWEMP
jgi:hypothetical protein